MEDNFLNYILVILLQYFKHKEILCAADIHNNMFHLANDLHSTYCSFSSKKNLISLLTVRINV